MGKSRCLAPLIVSLSAFWPPTSKRLPHAGLGRRFAKFGRAGMRGSAYYVKPDGSLWHSDLMGREPRDFVGDGSTDSPIFERFWQAGWRAWSEQASPAGQARAASIDADAALDERLINGEL